MAGSGNKIDLKQAQLDPGSVFSSPEQLRDHHALTREQKIDILRRWAYDASELADCSLWLPTPLTLSLPLGVRHAPPVSEFV